MGSHVRGDREGLRQYFKETPKNLKVFKARFYEVKKAGAGTHFCLNNNNKQKTAERDHFTTVFKYVKTG